VRRLRGEHTAEKLARHAQAWGLKWGTGRVAECEAGKVAATVPTIHRLCLALSNLLGRSVAPTELFDGEPLLQSVVSNQAVRRPPDRIMQQLAQQQRAFIERVWATLPEPLQGDPVGPYRKTLPAMVEADVRIGKSLGLDRAMTARWMAHLWKHPLSVERDKRAGPGASNQARGQITRQLKAELQKVIGDGHD
jgi:hypothetical protein